MFAIRLGIHVRTTHSPNKYPQRQIGVSIEACISILYEITRAKLVLSIENYLHTGCKYRKKNIGFIRGSLRTKSIYADGQKKRCSKSLTCNSKARAAQAYHDQNLEPSIWFIFNLSIVFTWYVGYIHVYILIAMALFYPSLLFLSQILDVALLLPVSIYLCAKWGNGISGVEIFSFDTNIRTNL